MRDYDDAANLRDDDQAADAEDSRQDAGAASAAVSFVGKTATDGAYPAAAQAVYRVDRYWVSGTEAEGASGTLTADGEKVYAWNYGDGVPPLGTEVIVTYVPNFHVFKFNS